MKLCIFLENIISCCPEFYNDSLKLCSSVSTFGFMVKILGFKGTIFLSGFSYPIVRLSDSGLTARLEIRGFCKDSSRFRQSNRATSAYSGFG